MQKIGDHEIGGWWFNHASKKLHDVSSDAGGGTNDHMGYVWASEHANGRKLGLLPHHVKALQHGYGFDVPEDHPDYGNGDWNRDTIDAVNHLQMHNTRITAFKGPRGHSVGVDTGGFTHDSLARAQTAIMHIQQSGENIPNHAKVYWEHTAYPNVHQSFHRESTVGELMAASNHRDLPLREHCGICPEDMHPHHDKVQKARRGIKRVAVGESVSKVLDALLTDDTSLRSTPSNSGNPST